MSLPTDPVAREMALRLLGWRLVTYESGLNNNERRYYGRRGHRDMETFTETFTSDTAAEAWKWMAETETGVRTPFTFVGP